MSAISLLSLILNRDKERKKTRTNSLIVYYSVCKLKLDQWKGMACKAPLGVQFVFERWFEVDLLAGCPICCNIWCTPEQINDNAKTRFQFIKRKAWCFLYVEFIFLKFWLYNGKTLLLKKFQIFSHKVAGWTFSSQFSELIRAVSLKRGNTDLLAPFAKAILFGREALNGKDTRLFERNENIFKLGHYFIYFVRAFNSLIMNEIPRRSLDNSLV